MISAQAQRTLVKSPPELWSELSNEESLARHLAEFGRVRITSSEPEKRVDWEADGVSGSVQMKASGWGTRVTLAVTREQPADEPSAVEAGSQAPGEHASLPGPQQASADDEPTGEAPEEPVCAAGESELASPAGEASVGDAAPSPPQADDHTGSQDTHTHADADSDSDAEAAEAEGAPSAPFAEQPGEPATDALGPPAQHREDSPIAPPPGEGAGGKRRGFFARLFRRRPARDQPLAPEREPELQAPAAAALPPEPQAQLPTPTATPTPTASELVAGPVCETEHPEETTGEPAAHEPDAAAEQEQAPQGPAAHEPDAAAEQQRVPQEPAASSTQGPEQHPADLSKELRLAEEAATEQVTAVLTAVLDRLGAAHHRPFSRS